MSEMHGRKRLRGERERKREHKERNKRYSIGHELTTYALSPPAPAPVGLGLAPSPASLPRCPLVKPAAAKPLAAYPPAPRPLPLGPPRWGASPRDSRSVACLTSGMVSFSFCAQIVLGGSIWWTKLNLTSACFSSPAFIASSSPNSTYASLGRPGCCIGQLTRVIYIENKV